MSTNTTQSSPSQRLSIHISYTARWKQDGVTVAGGIRDGSELNQLHFPYGLYVDEDDETVYVADNYNHRIVKWKKGATSGEVVAGGNRDGDRLNQLYRPSGVVIDKATDSLIISDSGNRRVMRWPCQSGAKEGEILISNIDCRGLTMDNQGFLYVTDRKKHEVKRYTIGEKEGTIVAGGNGEGNHLNQLNSPERVCVDRDQTVYVSDCFNNRVMKWFPGAKEGIIVAGGRGEGNEVTHLYCPQGLFIDQLSTIFVADSSNNRILRWDKGMEQGEVIVGGNEQGAAANQLCEPADLSFDRQGNLYVVDWSNHRVQRFSIEETTN